MKQLCVRAANRKTERLTFNKKVEMGNKDENSTSVQHDAKLPVSRSLLDKVCGSIYNEIPSLVYDDEFEQYDEGRGFRITEKTVGCEPPKLNDVLKWHSSNGRDKHSHFEVSKGEAYFSIYDGEESESIIWDLSKIHLHEQSNELIEWLADLV